MEIPYGNPFRLFVCRSNVAPSNPDDVTFADIEGLNVCIVRMLGKRTEVGYEIVDGDLLISISADEVIRTIYGLEMTGTYNGQPWRWKGDNVFRIVDSNKQSNVQPMETFGVETYYVDDILWVEVEDDTMTFTSHGHASLDGGTLALQSTEDTDVAVIGDKLVIIQKR